MQVCAIDSAIDFMYSARANDYYRYKYKGGTWNICSCRSCGSFSCFGHFSIFRQRKLLKNTVVSRVTKESHCHDERTHFIC